MLKAVTHHIWSRQDWRSGVRGLAFASFSDFLDCFAHGTPSLSLCRLTSLFMLLCPLRGAGLCLVTMRIVTGNSRHLCKLRTAVT